MYFLLFVFYIKIVCFIIVSITINITISINISIMISTRRNIIKSRNASQCACLLDMRVHKMAS